jgi:hypothetical protein
MVSSTAPPPAFPPCHPSDADGRGRGVGAGLGGRGQGLAGDPQGWPLQGQRQEDLVQPSGAFFCSPACPSSCGLARGARRLRLGHFAPQGAILRAPPPANRLSPSAFSLASSRTKNTAHHHTLLPPSRADHPPMGCDRCGRRDLRGLPGEVLCRPHRDLFQQVDARHL